MVMRGTNERRRKRSLLRVFFSFPLVFKSVGRVRVVFSKGSHPLVRLFTAVIIYSVAAAMMYTTHRQVPTEYNVQRVSSVSKEVNNIESYTNGPGVVVMQHKTFLFFFWHGIILKAKRGRR